MEISIEILNKKVCRVCISSRKLQSLYIDSNCSVLEKLRSFIQIEVTRLCVLNRFSYNLLSSRIMTSQNYQNGSAILA